MVSTALLLLALFGLLNLADAWTTWQIIRFGGHEDFWAPKSIMESIGTHKAIILIKVGLVALVWGTAWYLRNSGIPWLFYAGLDAFYAYIVYGNYQELQEHKK